MYKSSTFNLLLRGSNQETGVYNSLTGFVIRLQPSLATIFSSPGLISDDMLGEYTQPLKKAGIIVDECTDELSRYDAMGAELLFSSQSSTASFVIALTTACNYKCTYCYEKNCIVSSMSDDTVKHVISFIVNQCDSNANLEIIRLTWFGGEPLLALTPLEAIASQIQEYADARGIVLSTDIVTNGYLLSADVLALLTRYGLKRIQIPIDGRASTYETMKRPGVDCAYERVLSNIDSASRHVPVTIRLNCGPNNIESLYDFVIETKECFTDDYHDVRYALARLEGGNGFQALSLQDYSSVKMNFLQFLKDENLAEQVKNYLPKSHSIPCGLMQHNSFVIDPNGYLYKCEHYVGRPEYSIGDVTKGVTQPLKLREFQTYPLPDKCRKCRILPACRGGCTQKRIDGISSVDCESKLFEVIRIATMMIER